jgi:hypothetical protein
MKLDMDIYEMLRTLSISLLERMTLRELLTEEEPTPDLQSVRQLSIKFF